MKCSRQSRIEQYDARAGISTRPDSKRGGKCGFKSHHGALTPGSFNGRTPPAFAPNPMSPYNSRESWTGDQAMRIHCRKCGRYAPSNATGCNCGGEIVITVTDLRVRGKRIGAFTIPDQRDGNF